MCTAEDVPFPSKVALMEQTIRTFAPTPGTRTHVLLDTWYSAKSIPEGGPRTRLPDYDGAEEEPQPAGA